MSYRQHKANSPVTSLCTSKFSCAMVKKDVKLNSKLWPGRKRKESLTFKKLKRQKCLWHLRN